MSARGKAPIRAAAPQGLSIGAPWGLTLKKNAAIRIIRNAAVDVPRADGMVVPERRAVATTNGVAARRRGEARRGGAMGCR